jgi:HAD superfamily hydrolase (TIGR01549 family)
MTAHEPLAAVFFDIGGTLGTVSGAAPVRRLTPYPSTADLLRVMATTLGLRVGVITNIPDGMTTDDVRTMLSSAELLELIDGAAIITSRDAGVAKPDAAIYRYAAKRIGVPVERCLFVGECANEVAGARKVGMAALLKPRLA